MSLLREIPITEFSSSLNSIEKLLLYAQISYQIERKDCEINSLIIKFKINPAKLIDSITLDPRIDTRTEIVYKDILSKYGHKQVEKSRLYKMKKIIID